MTRFTPLWVQPGRYPAALDRMMLRAIWPWTATDGFNLIGVSGNQVTIGPGTAAVPTANNSGTVLCVSTANETIVHRGPPASGRVMYDTICIRPKAIDLDGSANAEWVFEKIEGPDANVGSGVNPVVPAGVCPLWRTRLLGGQASIDPTTMLDMRPKRLGHGRGANGRMYAASQTVLGYAQWAPVLNMADMGEAGSDIVFSPGSNSFNDPPALVAPYDGLYYVSASVHWQQNNTVVNLSGEIHSGVGLQVPAGGLGGPVPQMGAKVREWKGWAQVNTYPGSAGSDTVWLTGGTRVALWAMHWFGPSVTAIMGTWPGPQFTWLTLSYLGRGS
jgi:hypothetical protein